jgi:hypothetical protein
VYKYRLESSVVLRHSRSSDLAMLILNGTLVLGPKSTLLKKVKRSLPACSSTPTAARRLRASAYCESGKLCLQYHPLAPVSSAREPLCTTKATIRSNYPLPRIDEVWDQIGGSHFFSSLDLRSGYTQIRIVSEDTYKNCFRTRYGAYDDFWWCLSVSLERHTSFSR